VLRSERWVLLYKERGRPAISRKCGMIEVRYFLAWLSDLLPRPLSGEPLCRHGASIGTHHRVGWVRHQRENDIFMYQSTAGVGFSFAPRAAWPTDWTPASRARHLMVLANGHPGKRVRPIFRRKVDKAPAENTNNL